MAAYQRHGFKSYRHAEQITGVNYSTVYAIVSRGRIPTRGQVIEWAEGLGESINDWLALADYELITVPTEAEPDDLIRRYVERMRGELDRDHMEASIRRILDEEMREPEGHEPEL